MKKGAIILLSSIGFIVVILLVCGMNLWNHRNAAVDLEERIDAKYVSNKSSYDTLWKKFKEMTQVTDLQAEHYKEIYTGLIESRYEDANLLFKMVKEDNPKLDSSVYTQLQREISAGRDTFNNCQTQITDIIREYNAYVRKHPIMTAITGRETKDANEYVVTSEQTNKAFESKEAEEIKLR